ncbi:hypothetical protein FRC18_007068 [Serendipita sp. 400]|nr:hypothetical protein FRC18_007068 [Serendipita sp. 400]
MPVLKITSTEFTSSDLVVRPIFPDPECGLTLSNACCLPNGLKMSLCMCAEAHRSVQVAQSEVLPSYQLTLSLKADLSNGFLSRSIAILPREFFKYIGAYLRLTTTEVSERLSLLIVEIHFMQRSLE